MRCKTCDYPLWTIRARVCPECGSAFAPSDYEFNLNSVRFCCPHCDQQYFGTAANGHLEPRTFDCVKCRKRVDMDEMVLLPRDGIAEKLTETAKFPWTDKGRKWFVRRWFGTLGLSLGAPGRMMRMVPEESSSARALWFAFWNINFAAVASLGVAMLLIYLVSLGFGGGMGGGGGWGMMTIGLVIWVGASVLVPVAWAGVAHLICSPGSSKGASFDRSLQAIGYSSGAMVFCSAPCFGPYILPVALLWWTISCTIALREAHGISGMRALLGAIITPAVVLGGLATWFYLVFIAPITAMGAWNTGGAGSAGSYWSTVDQSNAQSMALAISAMTTGANGLYPTHGVELLGAGVVTPFEFGSALNLNQGNPSYMGVPLTRYLTNGQSVQSAIDALPSDVLAHRVGDYVFTWHGFGPTTGGDLWIAVLAPVGGSYAAGQGLSWWAIEADGDVTEVPYADRLYVLGDQNALRSDHGLGALPDLELVTDRTPAVP